MNPFVVVGGLAAAATAGYFFFFRGKEAHAVAPAAQNVASRASPDTHVPTPPAISHPAAPPPPPPPLPNPVGVYVQPPGPIGGFVVLLVISPSHLDAEGVRQHLAQTIGPIVQDVQPHAQHQFYLDGMSGSIIETTRWRVTLRTEQLSWAGIAGDVVCIARLI